MSIKSIVFDFGGVVCDFRYREYFSGLGYGDDDINFIINNVFNSPQWHRGMDLGKFELEEMQQDLHESYPDKIDIIDDALGVDMKNVLPIRLDVLEYIGELKKKGYRVYGLSNLSKVVHDSFNEQYLGFDDLFDGVTVSYLAGAIKPGSQEDPFDMSDAKIFEVFFRENDVDPSEALFIDDNEHNIKMGEMLGMKGILWAEDDDLGSIKEKVNQIYKGGKNGAE